MARPDRTVDLPRTRALSRTRLRARRAIRPAALVAALALTVAACGGEATEPFGTAEVTVEPVVQVIATPATVIARTYTATVRDAARVDVVAPTVATLAELAVEDGASVTAGQRIGRLSAEALATSLRQAESAYLSAVAGVRAATDALERSEGVPAERPTTFANRVEEVQVLLAESLKDVERLRAEGASDLRLRLEILNAEALRGEYDAWVRLNDQVTSAQASLRAAEQALEQTRAGVADLVLVAPVGGTVRIAPDLGAGGGRALGVGSDVAPGQPVVTVTSAGGHRIDLLVPESALAPVTVGSTVDVDLEAYPGRTLRGRIDRIVGASTPASAAASAATPGVATASGASFVAEVTIESDAGLALRDGLTGTAVLPDLAFVDRFEVRLEVDEIDVVLVEVGQQVAVELDALRGTPLTGTVVALAATPERSATGATIYRARVRLDAPDGDVPPLRGGLTGTGDVEVQRLEGPLTVPATALRRSGGSEVVYAVRGGVAVEVPVRVLAFGEVRAAVTGELRAGERVVTIGVERVEPGMTVEVG